MIRVASDNTAMNVLILDISCIVYQSHVAQVVKILHIDSWRLDGYGDHTEEYYRKMNNEGNGWEDKFSPDGRYETFVFRNHGEVVVVDGQVKMPGVTMPGVALKI